MGKFEDLKRKETFLSRAVIVVLCLILLIMAIATGKLYARGDRLGIIGIGLIAILVIFSVLYSNLKIVQLKLRLLGGRRKDSSKT